MSLRFESSCATPLVRATLAVTVALAAMMLAVFPAAAEAETGDKSAPSVVVRPGDSLWSISEERLGPNATVRGIMSGAEQIYALNRVRIGADPSQIFVGQELLVPTAMSGRPTGATPAHATAEAAGPGDRPAKGTTVEAAKTVPRTVPGGAAAESGEASERVAAREAESAILPDVAAAAPVPAVSMVASKGAQPSSVASLLRTVRTEFASASSALTKPFFGDSADARAQGRRLLGLGTMVLTLLTLLAAALIAAYGPGAPRRKARKWELRFRATYGSSYAAFDPFASHEDASRPVSRVRGNTAPSDGPTNAAAASEDRFDHMDLFAVARAKRERIRRKQPPGLRRQSPRLRVRGLRRQLRARPQRRPSSGRQRVPTRTRHKEWEPSTALVSTLGGLSLRPGTGHGEDLARLRPHLKEALGTLERLEQRRGLSESEKTRREALRALLASIERAG